MDGEAQRAELAHFLLTRRARLQPADVGLPPGQRRRTAGLRREEVAILAGVSVTWYTRLEQGRDIHVSAQVLEAIATALRLSPAERSHLFSLTGRIVPAGERGHVPTELLQMAAVPYWSMIVRGPLWEILAWNRIAESIWGADSQLFSGNGNFLVWFFTDAQARQAYLEWEEMSKRVVAGFRVVYERHTGEPAYEELLDRLRQASPEFTSSWDRYEIDLETPRAKGIEHPVVGRLDQIRMTFLLNSDPDIALLVEVPIPGTGTVEKLHRLLEASH